MDGQPVVLLEIERAFRHPVQFQGLELIRVGSYKKKLKDLPEKERALWRIFDCVSFEEGDRRRAGCETMKCCGCWIIRAISIS